MFRVLSLDENLETMRALVEAHMDAPVLLCNQSVGSTAEFALTDRYVRLVCPRAPVRRIVNSDGVYDVEAERQLDRNASQRWQAALRAVALTSHPASDSMMVTTHMPESWLPFVFQRNFRGRSWDAVRIHVSQPIINPAFANPHTQWAYNSNPQPQSYNKPYTFRTLQPPGQHLAEMHGMLDEWNRYVIVEQPPGDCIVCHGAKGEHKHFGTVAHGPDPYAGGLICKGCFRESMDQIAHLLD